METPENQCVKSVHLVKFVQFSVNYYCKKASLQVFDLFLNRYVSEVKDKNTRAMSLTLLWCL